MENLSADRQSRSLSADHDALFEQVVADYEFHRQFKIDDDVKTAMKDVVATLCSKSGLTKRGEIMAAVMWTYETITGDPAGYPPKYN